MTTPVIEDVQAELRAQHAAVTRLAREVEAAQPVQEIVLPGSVSRMDKNLRDPLGKMIAGLTTTVRDRGETS